MKRRREGRLGRRAWAADLLTKERDSVTDKSRKLAEEAEERERNRTGETGSEDSEGTQSEEERQGRQGGRGGRLFYTLRGGRLFYSFSNTHCSTLSRVSLLI